MDVRAKQLLCYQRRPLSFGGLSGGFAPRHLSRWTATFELDDMRYFALIFFILFLLNLQLFAQTDKDSRKGQFYLKHHLIFLKEPPKVSPDNIVFTDSCYCSFNPDVYSGDILRRGDKSC